MKKTLLLMLALIMTCAIFVGCNGNGSDDSGTTTESQLENDAPEIKEIKVEDLAKYEMIRSANAGASVISAFAELMSKIRSDFKINISARDDFYREGVESLKKGELEILVGETNRDESVEFLSKLKRDEYGYGMINDKLIIAGHTEEGTIKAIESFLEMLGKGDRTEIFFDNVNDRYVKTVSYPMDDLKLNGVSAFEYAFVYPSSNKNMERELAEKLRERIADMCGAYPRVIDDKTAISGKTLVIGNASVVSDAQKSAYTSAMGSDSDGVKYYTLADDSIIWLNADDVFGLIAAVSEISDKINKDTSDVLLDTGVKTAKAGDGISVMSFNVWVSEATTERKKRVIEMINKYTPDIMGVQEASPAWMTTLKNGIGTVYSCVGEGRNGGDSGEYSAIFYRKDKFTVIESGTKWLSDTPDKAGSKVSSSSLPRIMTYAVLERKSDGMRFLYVNTHLEHTSKEPRMAQVEVLLKEIAKLPELPTVVTGDFNCTTGEETYNKMTDGSFIDAALTAKNTSDRNSATFHNYGASSKRIDYIFASTGDVYIDSYEVCDEQIDGDYVSDHHPIYAEISIIG